MLTANHNLFAVVHIEEPTISVENMVRKVVEKLMISN